MIFPIQGGFATVIGDRIVIDSVDLDFPSSIGLVNQVLTITNVANGTLNWVTPTVGAPVAAQYLVLSLDATLTVERLFTPSTGLTAVDSGAGAAYTLTSDLSTGVSGGQSVIGGTDLGDNLTFQSTSDGTKGFILLTDGSLVGIGSGAGIPLHELHLQTDQNADTRFFLRNANTGNAARGSLELQSDVAGLLLQSSSSTFSGTTFGLARASSVSLLAFDSPGGGLSRLLFGTTDAVDIHFGTNNLLAMTIDSSQQVGIGTATPDVDFHVRSGTAGIISLIERTLAGTSAVASVAAFRATSTGNMVDGFGVCFQFQIEDNAGTPNTIASICAERAGADNTGDLLFFTNAAGVGTEKARITSGGDFGIGTDSPQELFHVSGNTAKFEISAIDDVIPAILYNPNTTANNSAALEFFSDNSIAVEKSFARMRCTYINHTNGVEDSKLDFDVMISGLVTTVFTVLSTGVTVTGKLTVSGAIDPTSVLLSGGTALFYESNDGATAAVSGAATGRIRYNNGAAAWQISVQGGAYADIVTGTGNTLDQAYDSGGVGAGRIITADSGAVEIAGTDGLVITQAVNTSESPTAFLVTGGAHTTLTASAEAIDVDVDLARTVQFSTGAIATQRAMVIQAPTYGFVGASVITTAATVDITGAPIAGTNATITNSFGLRVAGNIQMNGDFDFTPATTDEGELGTDALKWKRIRATDIVADDMHFKGRGQDYTLFEDEDGLRLRNNKTKKTYRMMMEEVV